MATTSQNTEFIKKLAVQLGFEYCGIAKAKKLETPMPEVLKAGYKMTCMER